jgi:hypothetical protein
MKIPVSIKEPPVYELRAGDRELVLDAECLIAYARRLFIEREFDLPPGTLASGGTKRPRSGWYRARGHFGSWTQAHLDVASLLPLCGFRSALSETERRRRRSHIGLAPPDWHRCQRCEEPESA